MRSNSLNKYGLHHIAGVDWLERVDAESYFNDLTGLRSFKHYRRKTGFQFVQGTDYINHGEGNKAYYTPDSIARFAKTVNEFVNETANT